MEKINPVTNCKTIKVIEDFGCNESLSHAVVVRAGALRPLTIFIVPGYMDTSVIEHL